MRIFGQHDNKTIEQLRTCANIVPDTVAVLMADGHLGYSMPIGGVVAYPQHISPSGVGYDIGCGNLAIKTDVDASLCNDKDFDAIAKEIEKQISFGIGRKNYDEIDSPVFDKIDQSPSEPQRSLLGLAKSQLGTVGSGNHYVDLLMDENHTLWVGIHFGSRGFGFQTANGFLNLASNKGFFEKRGNGEMMTPPVLLPVDKPLGQDYIECMRIAGEYAYEGRRAVGTKVLGILGAKPIAVIHNHHNFAWNEVHGGKPYWVVRKGATPAFPGQLGFVGGSMGDICVIVKGIESQLSKDSLYSTVHGAGRLRSRQAAKNGKYAWACHVAGCTQYFMDTPPPNNLKCPKHTDKPLFRDEIFKPLNYPEILSDLRKKGVTVRGGGADESPDVYRRLSDVLDKHVGTIEILHTLTPRVVVMAGSNENDPYKD